MAQYDKIGLAEAAMLMGLSWPQAWAALLRNEIEGHKVNGRWLVSVASVTAWRRNANKQ